MIKSIISEYYSSHRDRLGKVYNWPLNLRGFPHENYSPKGSTSYERTKNLRRDINRFITREPSRRLEYYRWYVTVWGGVIGNSPNTLEAYANKTSAELISRREAGVATWSKILAIRDPDNYAIYDARVALSLNCLQVLCGIKEIQMFPLLKSRNTSFVVPTQSRLRRTTHSKIPAADFYNTYVGLLKAVANDVGAGDLQDVEMLLFALSEELSRVFSDSEK